MLRQYIKEYLGFNATETKGFLVLMSLIFLGLFLPLLLNYLPDNKPDNFIADQQKLKEYTAAIALKHVEKPVYKQYPNDTDDSEPHGQFTPYHKPIHLFAFDPNQISAPQWQDLGMPKWLAERIVKYREKGGKFRKKEDLLRIYGFPQTLYASVEAYIQLPDVGGTTPNYASAEKATPLPTPEIGKPKFEKLTAFDLNKADTTQLVKLKGIGSKLALRIVKFRESLGGFYAENQLKDVFGLDSAVVQEALKYAFVKEAVIRKIKINEVTPDDFKHPYLRPFVAKNIMAYRQQHGRFGGKEDLAKIKTLDAATLEKILPYLEF